MAKLPSASFGAKPSLKLTLSFFLGTLLFCWMLILEVHHLFGGPIPFEDMGLFRWLAVPFVFVAAPFGLAGLVFLSLGYPRLDVYPDRIVFSQFPFLRKTYDLQRLGTPYKVTISNIQFICFLSKEAEQRFLVEKAINTQTPLNADVSISLQFFDQAEIDHILAEIERVRLLCDVPAADGSSQKSSQSRAKTQTWRTRKILKVSAIVACFLLLGTVTFFDGNRQVNWDNWVSMSIMVFFVIGTAALTSWELFGQEFAPKARELIEKFTLIFGGTAVLGFFSWILFSLYFY